MNVHKGSIANSLNDAAAVSEELAGFPEVTWGQPAAAASTAPIA